MTLPVVIGASARRSREDSREAGMLYGINTLGAVAGTVAASFLLVPQIGLLRTCLVAGALDAAVALLAWLLDRDVGVIESSPGADSRAARTAAPSSTRAGGPSPHQWAVLGLFAISGAIAIGFEVAWFRILGLTFGPSVYAFAAMLAIYLLGVGAGSALAGPWVQRTRLSGLGLFASLEAALAAVGLAALLLVNALPSLYVSVFRGLLGPLHEGALAGSQLAVAGALVFLPCLIMGMIFPAAVRAFREAGRDGSPESNVGRLYVWNTIGGIAGSLVTGFVLLPRFGVWSTMTGAAVGSLLVASGVAGVAIARAGSFLRVRRDLIGMVPGVLAVLTVVWFIPRWNIADFNRGRYRFLYSATSDQEKLDPGQLIYHREGVNVSVAVYRGLGAASLHIGGKPDASTNLSDILTQCLSGHLPLMFAPRIEKVGVVGYGSGMTAGAALTHPEVRELDLMEIEEAVIDASVYFDCISDDPLDDPRTHLLVEDGRVHLTYAPDKYDVLISEPSNPWMAGITNLFTREFTTRSCGTISNPTASLRSGSRTTISPRRSARSWRRCTTRFP
ncbi:MAG: hypothetical protein R3E12_07285 [Candidatus Eisenbacteria bacterium]